MDNLGASERPDARNPALEAAINRTIKAVVIGWSRKQRGTNNVNGQIEKELVDDGDPAIQWRRDKSPKH